MAQEAGFDTYAVQPSSWAVGHARELGVPVFEGTLDQWAAAHPGLLADVVALWHVLEHVPDPRSLMRDAAAITRPGGLVVLEVPNGASTECERLGIEWDATQPNDHVILFSPRACEPSPQPRAWRWSKSWRSPTASTAGPMRGGVAATPRW